MTHRSPDAARLHAMVALSALPGVGDVTIARQLAAYGSAEAVLLHYPPSAREAAVAVADAVLAATDRIGARALVGADTDYPSRLHELHDAPAVLFARGTIAAAEPPAVAIVGTRMASSYGIRVARAIATACARAGATVVSGLARGIDGAAHEAALAAGGRTVAVLGTGLDVFYPRSHRSLQENIARDGLLLSELPPGASGHSGTFPRRNRIIAALADVTVVVEAGYKSGALITADQALELGRIVACVPNAIDVAGAAGSNALLKRNAEPVLCADDVLALLELRAAPSALPILDDDAASCWDAIQHGAVDVAAITRVTRLTMRRVSTALSALELEGLIGIDAEGRVRSTISST